MTELVLPSVEDIIEAERSSARQRTARYRANSHRDRDNHLRRNYDISLSEYQAMQISQNGRCAICRREYDKLVPDHNHDTGNVRGLLCNACNMGLGMFGDSIEMLAEAIVYLSGKAA